MALLDLELRAPTITIVVPVYNGEKYLESALTSIKNQTCTDFECLVVDDGSVNTIFVLNIVSHLNDTRFRVLRKENGGVASALNLAIANARGKYFCWLSHDDMWDTQKLESQLRIISEDEILCSNYSLIDEIENLIGVTAFEKKFDVTSGIKMLTRGLIHGCSVMAPMSLFKIAGNFDTELKFTQDYDLWLRAIEKGFKFRFQEFPTTIGRIHSEQTGKRSDTRIENNQLWQRIIEFWFKTEILGEKFDRKNALVEVQIFKDWALNNSLLYAAEILDLKIKELLAPIKVSIIVPYRDRISTLHEAISSVNSQSHRNIEVILVDDSHDPANPTEKLSDRLNIDPSIPVKIIENPRIGVSSARNVGLKHASGDYLAFLDSDDLFLPNKIKDQLQIMVMTDTLFSHTNYLQLENMKNAITDTSINSGPNVVESMLHGCRVATPTVMLARVTGIEKLFNESLSMGEDSDAWIKYLSTHGRRVSHLESPLSLVRTNAGSSRYNQNAVNEVVTRSLGTSRRLFSKKNNMVMRIRQLAIRLLFSLWVKIGRPRFIRENVVAKRLFWRIRGF